MTFGLTYFTSENYILVLSHDEVVHLKGSMIHKMPGLLEDKFANLKLGYTFMFGHPGKKLLFMGQDSGQFHEWDEKTALDWYLSEEPLGKNLKHYVRDLLHLYKKYPALYEKDYDWEGFDWVNANDSERSIFSFIRYGKNHKRSLLFVLNFTPVARSNYRAGVPQRGTYTLILDQDHGQYKRGEKALTFRSEKIESDGRKYSFPYPLPAYGTAVFRF
jgi:1,4-alpha-glucan branching enzyme